MKTKLLSMVTLVFLLGVGLTACNNVKDSDLETKAIEVLATTPDDANIDVTVADKVATLSGSVEDEATKNAAETSVKGIKGIESVVNNIMVIPPAPDYTEMNASLNKALVDALKDHPTVMAEVKDGEIILTGEVREKDLPMVMEKVMALNPLKVENNLTIK
ncbi:MAG: BON domain-containing protein [Bacteroidales bacterium]|jgi:osmotically-inducible protein OsmY|nr:BON domain-containing protein [Bacteroidales bacterium]